MCVCVCVCVYIFNFALTTCYTKIPLSINSQTYHSQTFNTNCHKHRSNFNFETSISKPVFSLGSLGEDYILGVSLQMRCETFCNGYR